MYIGQPNILRWLTSGFLPEKTSLEVFFGKKLEVNHLKIFDCPIYIHIPKEKRTKLDPSGNKGIFVGYSESLKLIEYTS